MLPSFFKNDSLITGISIGIILPFVLYFALYGIDLLAFKTFSSHIVSKPQYLYLLSIVANLFPIKFYFVNKKKEATGRGVLIVTIFLGMLYFPFFG